jgi:predicted permease
MLNKYLVWPALGLTAVWLDRTYLHTLNQLSQQVLLLLTWVPIAANTVSFATVLKAHPEKAALAVVASTVLALLFVPAYASILL